MTLARFWINQPSTLQPLHKWHGVNVIAPIADGETHCYIYFTSGEVISMRCPRLALSPGWRPSTTPLESAIVNILFPSGDPDHQWDASTPSDIADAILEHRPELIPPGERPDL